MYYYGNNGYYQPSGYSYAGCTQGCGGGAAIWIVLFILLVIIIGAGLNFGGNQNHGCNTCNNII
ncbi:MAG: sporulation protein YjcZ [bacterium]